MKYPRIRGVVGMGPYRLRVEFDNGVEAELDLARTAAKFAAFRSVDDPDAWASAEVGDFGETVVWPGENPEVGADDLWREYLVSCGRSMRPEVFRAWRENLGWNIKTAADALGLTARTLQGYESGQAVIPRTVVLACKGLLAERAAENVRLLAGELGQVVELGG